MSLDGDVQYYFEATVLNGQQEPVEGAALTVEDDSGEVEVTWGESSNTTDAEGTVGGLLYDGEYTAIAEYEDDSGSVLTGSTDFTIAGADVEFEIVLGEGSVGTGGGGSSGATGTTDADGVFAFQSPDGDYRVTVDHPDEDAVTDGEVSVAGAGLDINVELGGGVTTSGSGGDDGDDEVNVKLAAIVETALTVETLEASEVGTSSAMLHGELTEIEGVEEATVAFEWVASDGSFPDETSWQTLDGTGEFSEELSGLESDTAYDYRAVAEADGETETGREMTFTTAVSGE